MVTLKTLPQASAQEVFDHIAVHMLEQKRRALNVDGDCQYRNRDGLRCAAGCLMTDDEYEDVFEGMVWLELVEYAWVPSQHHDLIVHMQSVHDFTEPRRWAEMLKVIAVARGLSDAVIRPFTDTKPHRVFYGSATHASY